MVFQLRARACRPTDLEFVGNEIIFLQQLLFRLAAQNRPQVVRTQPTSLFRLESRVESFADALTFRFNLRMQKIVGGLSAVQSVQLNMMPWKVAVLFLCNSNKKVGAYLTDSKFLIKYR